MTVTVYGKPVVLTAETIQATREWFAENARACIAEATAGVFRVNDLPGYVIQQEGRIAYSLAGTGDNTLTFVQRALYIQTGESVPLLSGGQSEV